MSSEWSQLESVDIGAINSDVSAGERTADVAVYYPNNLDPAHQEKVTPELVVEGFHHAKEIFGAVNVQLNLTAFMTGHLEPRYFEVNSTPMPTMPSGRFTNMYRNAERHPSTLSEDAQAAFEAIVPVTTDGDRTVHIVVLEDVYMSFFEQLDFRSYQLKTISTGGLSFPGYMYGATMPRHLRGVITITDITKDANSWKTVAHELGHKLLNVSHEYRDTSPQHEVRADGGLMLYGKGTEIASGAEGRFHRERLYVSPFLYRMQPDGTKRWNPDYVGDGFYYDPIYDGISVDLDADAG